MNSLRSWVRRMHLALGLSVGLVLAVSGLTGSALVFGDELDRLFNAGLLRAPSGSGTPRLGPAIEAVRKVSPALPIAFIRLPREPGDSYEFWLGKEPYRVVYVDPGSAQILGTRGQYDGVLGVLGDLHINLLSGETGHRVMGFVALAVLLMLVSGLWLAWPRDGRFRRIFRLRTGQGRTKLLFDLHRSLGVAGWMLLLASTLTGAMLVFHHTAAAVLLSMLGGTAPPTPPRIDSQGGGQPLPASMLLERGAAALPEATPTWIMLSSGPQPFMVRLRYPENTHPNGTSYVAVHPRTGAVLASHSYRTAGGGLRASDLKYPIHIGTVFGLPGRVLVFITGLAPTVLLLSGFLFWRRRHAGPRRARSAAAGRARA